MGEWSTFTLLPCINTGTVVSTPVPVQQERDAAFISFQNIISLSFVLLLLLIKSKAKSQAYNFIVSSGDFFILCILLILNSDRLMMICSL